MTNDQASTPEVSEDILKEIAEEMRDDADAEAKPQEGQTLEIDASQESDEETEQQVEQELDAEVEGERQADTQETGEDSEDVSKLIEPSEPMAQEAQLRLLEAILFASAEPLSPKALHERLPDEADLNVLLPILHDQYKGRGVELIEIDGHWAFRTASDIAKSLTIEKEVNKKMSRAMLETMAIIAYHQPLTRAEIENIRGVATHRGTLDTLMEMEWIKPGRRRETPGRPLTWMTTTKFLDHFQLESLNELPGLEDLKASGLLDKRPAIDTIPDTGDLFDSADEDAEEMLEAQERQDQIDADDNFIESITNDMIDGSSDEGEEEDV